MPRHLPLPLGEAPPEGAERVKTPSVRLAKSRPTGGCSLAQRLRALESRLMPCQLSQRECQGALLHLLTLSSNEGILCKKVG